jgi:hypothetical protein
MAPGSLDVAVYIKKIFDYFSGRSILAGDNATLAASGQITVTTAGTAVKGPNVVNASGFYIKALSGNTGKVYVGNVNGDIDSGNSFELAAGDLIIGQVVNLNELWFDAATSADKFCWLKA